jgi:hypothetical protein
MSLFYTDQIKLIVITRDKFGAHTESAAVTYDCIIEDTNKLIYNNKGQMEKANALIMIDSIFTGSKGDMIQLFKQFGIETGDTKKYEIKQIFETGGLSSSHKEVLI